GGACGRCRPPARGGVGTRLVGGGAEPLAVRRLRRLLKGERDVKVIGACGDVPAARREIAAQGPDLLLLDVQLSGADGLALLDGLPAARRPAVIFVTAYERYAIPAFDHQAVD